MRQVVAYLMASHGYSQRRACRLTRLGRSTQRRISRRDPRIELRQCMHEIVSTRVRYGYRRVHVMLRRAGWSVGRNVDTMYCFVDAELDCGQGASYAELLLSSVAGGAAKTHQASQRCPGLRY